MFSGLFCVYTVAVVLLHNCSSVII